LRPTARSVTRIARGDGAGLERVVRGMSASARPMPDRARFSALAIRLLLLSCVASCSITTETARSDAELELARNRQRWSSAGIHDYEFDFHRSCFCPEEATERVHIVVRNDVVTSVLRARDGQAASARVGAWPRVDDLFDDVRRRLEEGADRLEVQYDPLYGYPRSIVADVIFMAVDDEYSISATNLRRLP
jgi:hypothetical protein